MCVWCNDLSCGVSMWTLLCSTDWSRVGLGSFEVAIVSRRYTGAGLSR